ncbi:MAG: 2-hydroxychromene-2-carboxylate isomerase [Pseudomonadota bacterium]
MTDLGEQSDAPPSLGTVQFQEYVFVPNQKPVHVDYYFSVNSPWSFMATDRFIGMLDRYGATVDVMPADLSTIFPQSGGLPLPKRSPQRQAYRMMELKRWSKFLRIPIVMEPANFPSPEEIPVRTVIAARHTGVDPLKVAREIGSALWVDDKSIADWDLMAEIIQKLGGDADQTLAMAREPQRLTEYKDFTQKAMGAGVFGAPTYVIDGEVFWGQDRIDFVERALAEKSGK